MPATTPADDGVINYFLRNYEGFAQQATEFQTRHKLYEFVYKYSLFSDPEDFNELILIGYDPETEKEIERISVFEKGY